MIAETVTAYLVLAGEPLFRWSNERACESDGQNEEDDEYHDKGVVRQKPVVAETDRKAEFVILCHGLESVCTVIWSVREWYHTIQVCEVCDTCSGLW